MQTLIVLFNLKDGADADTYEEWAKARDLPGVRALKNCERFDVLRTTGVFGTDAAAPYQYVEIIDITDLAEFRSEAGSEAMQSVVAEFREFADQPIFMVSENIEA